MSTYFKFTVYFVLTALLGTSFYSFFGRLYETASAVDAAFFLLKTAGFSMSICAVGLLILLPVAHAFALGHHSEEEEAQRQADFRNVLKRMTLILHLILYPGFAIIAEFISDEAPSTLPSMPILAVLSGILMLYANLYNIPKICKLHTPANGDSTDKGFDSSLKWLYRFLLSGTALIWFTPLAAASFFIPMQDIVNPVAEYRLFMQQAYSGTMAALLLTGLPTLIFCLDFRRQTGKLTQWVLERKTNHHFQDHLSYCFMGDMIELEDKINCFMNRLQNTISFLEEESTKIINEKEELVQTGENAVETLRSISETLDQIRDSSVSQKEVIDVVESEVDSLVSGSIEMIQQVASQNQSIQQSSASVSEISSAVASIADMARQANIVSTMMKESSESGHQILNRTTDTIKSIQTSSLDIQQILQSIQKIAKQTNLLSMNASIEAAHAGDTGLGFAIVADEVRSLSSLSNRNAKEIETHIEMMIDKVNHGVEAITDAGNAFADIVNGIGENFELMSRITDSMNMQQKSTQTTLESTFSIVKSVEQIASYSEKQNQYTQNAKKIMNEVVACADLIEKTIEKQQKELETASDFARKAIVNIESDRATAGEMLQFVQIFQNNTPQEENQ